MSMLDGKPFNFAIATLMRLDQILQEIKRVSVIRSGEAQATKLILGKQFIVNACALIEAKDKEKALWADLKAIKLKVNNKKDGAGRDMGSSIEYDWDIDVKLDELLMKAENVLQEEGNYFMPDKFDDEGL